MKWLILVVSVAALVVIALAYDKIRKCGCKNSEKYHDSVYAYINAYNSVYGTPRPNFYDMCPQYNQWVKDANYVGKIIVDECKKKYPKDPRCPRYMPWTPAPCSSLQQQYSITENYDPNMTCSEATQIIEHGACTTAACIKCSDAHDTWKIKKCYGPA